MGCGKGWRGVVGLLGELYPMTVTEAELVVGNRVMWVWWGWQVLAGWEVF